MKPSTAVSPKVAFASVMMATMCYGNAFAQSSDVPVIGPKSEQQIVADFLLDKNNERAAANSAHQKRGVAADAVELRQMAKALTFEKPSPGSDITQSDTDALSDNLAMDAADYLISIGWNSNEVRTIQRNGFDSLSAAIRLIRGSSSQMDRIMLSPYLVLGKVSAVRVENLGDGFGSTVVLSNLQMLAEPKGKPVASTIAIRQSSGLSTPRGAIFYDSDISRSDVGKSYMILLSDDRYIQKASEGNKGTAKGKNGEAFMVRSAYDLPSLNEAGNEFQFPLEDGTASVEQLKAKLAVVRK